MVYASRFAFAGALLSSSLAFASPELDRARATFAEALADEEAGRFAVALAAFRRVAEVRDTAQVEYRIGTCLESLGQRRAALVAYDHAAHLGRGDPSAQDVVSSSNDHMASLASEMGKLGVTVHGSDAADVRVDGAAASADERATAIVLEPGIHVVEVTAPHMKPTRATITIARARKLDLTVDLVAEAPAIATSRTRPIVGVVLVSVGAAFAIGAGVSLFARNDLIDTIKTDCPGNVCQLSQKSDIEDKRSTASALAPLAAVLGGVALACVGVGAALVILGPTSIAVGGRF